MLINREVLLAKIESSYGVDPTPVAGTDAVLVENPSWSNEGARMNERPAVRSSLGSLQQVYGGALMTVAFDIELKGPGTAYSASVKPEMATLLRACGFGETIDTTGGSEKATYAPVSTALESCTIYYFQDGTRFVLTGCRGNVSFNLEVGAVPKASFTMTGHVAGPTDVAVPAPTYDSAVPPPVIGGAFTIDAFAAVIGALAFDMSNAMSFPPDLSAADGFGEIQITKRDVNGSFDPEHELVAAEDFIGNWKTGKSMVLATGSIGSTQYNKFKMDMPAVYYRETAPGDRDGIRTLENAFGAVESAGDDEVSIEFS